jgi:hypothetical protein
VWREGAEIVFTVKFDGLVDVRTAGCFAGSVNGKSIMGILMLVAVAVVVFQILTEGVHRYEGTINQFTGDGIMAIFGAPIARENHAQRACHAALAIQKGLAEYEEKIKRRLREKKLGPYDQQRIDILRRFKDDVGEVRSGFECGIGLEHFSDIKIGDIIEAYIIEKIQPTSL